jgi:hypothetical protein
VAFEPEFKPILDRGKHKHDFDEHFLEVESLLKDITNYGSNLIPRCFASSKRNLEDTIIIGTLLKQVVAMVDAAEILISNAALYSSHLQARAGFEASLYIDWILKSDTEKKAKYFYVSNLREDKLWAQRMAGTSPDQAKFEPIIEEMGFHLVEDADEMSKKAKKQIAEIDEILSGTSFKDINIHVQHYKDQKRLDYEPSWYSPLGISSVRKIAIDVGRLMEYVIYYSLTSEIMHSSRYHHHMGFKDGKLIFEPIRCLKEIKNLINFIFSCTMGTYMKILKHYRPDELPAFGRKYIEDWRKPFLTVKSVQYAVEDSQTI